MPVYVFGEPGMLLVKVGVSGRTAALAEREKTLGRFWQGGKFLYVSDYGATGLDERRAHRMLKTRYWFQGEWFVCGPDTARAVVRRAIRIGREAREEAMRKHRRSVPQIVKQILAEAARRPDRQITERDSQRIEEAWKKWEAAGGQPRRRLYRRRQT